MQIILWIALTVLLLCLTIAIWIIVNLTKGLVIIKKAYDEQADEIVKYKTRINKSSGVLTSVKPRTEMVSIFQNCAHRGEMFN